MFGTLPDELHTLLAGLEPVELANVPKDLAAVFRLYSGPLSTITDAKSVSPEGTESAASAAVEAVTCSTAPKVAAAECNSNSDEVKFFKLPVFQKPSYKGEELSSTDKNCNKMTLLSLQRRTVPVWQWVKGGKTGFWRRSLDAVFEDGSWNAGKELGLVVCGVDACMAGKLDRSMTLAFTRTREEFKQALELMQALELGQAFPLERWGFGIGMEL